jgi:uncharacterized protein YdaT
MKHLPPIVRENAIEIANAPLEGGHGRGQGYPHRDR